MLDMSAAKVPLINTLSMSNTVVKSSLMEKNKHLFKSDGKAKAISGSEWGVSDLTCLTACPLYHCWWCPAEAPPTLSSAVCYAVPYQTSRPPRPRDKKSKIKERKKKSSVQFNQILLTFICLLTSGTQYKEMKLTRGRSTQRLYLFCQLKSRWCMRERDNSCTPDWVSASRPRASSAWLCSRPGTGPHAS